MVYKICKDIGDLGREATYCRHSDETCITIPLCYKINQLICTEFFLETPTKIIKRWSICIYSRQNQTHVI